MCSLALTGDITARANELEKKNNITALERGLAGRPKYDDLVKRGVVSSDNNPGKLLASLFCTNSCQPT